MSSLARKQRVNRRMCWLCACFAEPVEHHIDRVLGIREGGVMLGGGTGWVAGIGVLSRGWPEGESLSYGIHEKIFLSYKRVEEVFVRSATVGSQSASKRPCVSIEAVQVLGGKSIPLVGRITTDFERGRDDGVNGREPLGSPLSPPMLPSGMERKSELRHGNWGLDHSHKLLLEWVNQQMDQVNGQPRSS